MEVAPKTVKDVYNSQFKRVWINAVNREVEGLERKNTWTVIDSPPGGEKAIDSKWTRRWKTDEHGCVRKGKARLVPRGDRQEISDISMFRPTPSSTTSGVAAADACTDGNTIFHLDVEETFVQSELKDEVYMRQV
ncbi:unnamed protein product [Sphacelaria rigidula]